MILKKVLATCAIAILSLPVCGQDLLARQAPVDKRMKSIDSLSLRRMLPDLNFSNSSYSPVSNGAAPAAELYPEWSNKRGRQVVSKKPSEYKIDLRNFCMPCDSRRVTSHYGYRASFGRMHYGTDIKLYVGDTVRSAFSGKIRTVAYEGKGYGNYIIIRHDNGLETVYGHLSKHLCKENQYVRAGDVIGLGGNTGRSYGSHLHFETRFLGEHIDPEKLFHFEAHDTKGDYYVYRSSGNSSVVGNPRHANPAPVVASNTPKVEKKVVEEKKTVKPEQQVAKVDKKDEKKSDKKVAEKKDEKKSDKKSDKKVAEKKDDKKSEKKVAKKNHTVKKGDTLYSIAKSNNTTVEQLRKLNHISEDATIKPGQSLRCS